LPTLVVDFPGNTLVKHGYTTKVHKHSCPW